MCNCTHMAASMDSSAVGLVLSSLLSIKSGELFYWKGNLTMKSGARKIVHPEAKCRSDQGYILAPR